MGAKRAETRLGSEETLPMRNWQRAVEHLGCWIAVNSEWDGMGMGPDCVG